MTYERIEIDGEDFCEETKLVRVARPTLVGKKAQLERKIVAVQEELNDINAQLDILGPEVIVEEVPKE